MTLTVLDLFSGIGGFSLGLERTGGFRTVAFCEIEPYCRRVLAKHWPEVPCYDDVRTLDAARLDADGIGRIDAICGGFPCQDISVAGRQAGLDGERSGLWSEIIRLAGEVGPRFILVENVAALLDLGMDRVLGDLATLGFDAEWHCIPASAVGAPHRRDRVWIVAHAEREGLSGLVSYLGPFIRSAQTQPIDSNPGFDEWAALDRGKRIVRSGDGVPLGVERSRIKALGNAVVPQIPELLGRAILASMREAA
jgi:DNA (cytosine-5)-methyltransferase 1